MSRKNPKEQKNCHCPFNKCDKENKQKKRVNFKLLFFLVILILFFLSQVLVSKGAPDNSGSSMIQGTSYENVSPVAAQWANRGVELFEQGDYRKAIEYMYEAWKLDPNSAGEYAKILSKAHNNYAKELYDNNRKADALAISRKAVFFDETNTVARKNLDMLIKSNNSDPENFDFRAKEARNLRSSGYIEEAVAEYLKAIELSQVKYKDKTADLKLELAQIYQILFGKYSGSPVGKAQFKKMAALIKDVNATKPNDPKPHILLGRAYLVGNDFTRSIKSFENALKLSPNDKEALDGLVGAWKRVVELAPGEPDNLIGYGTALIRAGYESEGRKYLKDAEKIDPTKKADEMMASTRQLATTNESFKLAMKAFEYQKSGNLDRAIELYEESLKGLPPTPEASDVYYNLAVAYESKNQLRKASVNLQKALRLNSTNQPASEALNRVDGEIKRWRGDELKRAVSLQEKSRLNEAIQVYKALLIDFPDDDQVHFNLGTAYQEAGKLDLALAEYKIADKLSPDTMDYKTAVISLERAIGAGAMEAAKADSLVKEAIKLQMDGKLDASISKYQEAISANPKNAQAHFNLGTVFHSMKRAEGAIREYELAYKLAPGSYPEALYFMGNLYEILNKPDEAVNNYRKYLEIAPSGEYFSQAQQRIGAVK